MSRAQTCFSIVCMQGNSKVCIIYDEEMLNHILHQQPTMRDLAELVLFMIGFKGSFIFLPHLLIHESNLLKSEFYFLPHL
jgi:hypothetical protein